MEEHLVEFVLALASAGVIGLFLWVLRMSIRIAVMEAHMQRIPDLLADIKTELHGIREDAKGRHESLHGRIDKVRDELRDELKGKADAGLQNNNHRQ